MVLVIFLLIIVLPLLILILAMNLDCEEEPILLTKAPSETVE